MSKWFKKKEKQSIKEEHRFLAIVDGVEYSIFDAKEDAEWFTFYESDVKIIKVKHYVGHYE